MRSDRIKGRFTHNGVLIVPVRVNGFDVQFLVDTGAAYCAVREETASFLGINFQPENMISILPVGKQAVTAALGSVENFGVGGVKVKNLPTLLLDLPPQIKVDGVLGMNFLRKFRFCVEPNSAALILRR